MRKQLTRAMLVTGTVAAALCLGIPAAVAANTWTVTGGTNFKALESPSAAFVLTDLTAGSDFVCMTGFAKGTVTDERDGTNTAVGSVTESTFGDSNNQCQGTGNAAGVKGTIAQKSTATLNVSTYNSPNSTGTITNVDEILTAAGGLCTMEVTGTAGVTYNNTTDVLTFTSTGDRLSVRSASTLCVGFHIGDTVTFFSGPGGLEVTGIPNNPIQVLQP